MKTDLKYSIDMPSEIGNICGTVKNITGYIQESCENLNSDCMFELKVILNELLINAVKHGNKGDPEKTVRVTCGINFGKYIYFTVEDQGTGYDYSCTLYRNENTDVINDICDMKETGRGIMIVKNLCSGIRFNNRGNKVVVLKEISQKH